MTVAVQFAPPPLTTQFGVGDRPESSFARVGNDPEAQTLAIDIGCAQHDSGRRVLIRYHRLTVGDRRVVHRRNGDRDSGHVRIMAAVIDLVRKIIVAIVVGCRRVGHRCCTA